MAENEEAKENPTPDAAQTENEEAPAAGKSKSKLFILLGVGGLLFVGLTATTLLLVLGGDEPSTPEAEVASEATQDDKEEADGAATALGSPQFFPIRPAIVVNIPSKGRIRFLQIQVDIMSRDDDVIEDLEAYAPLIKNELISLFSSQNYAEMVTVEGKETLRKEALKRVQKVMSEQAGVEGIEQILFTSFVTQ